ncbi:hypothetical protein CEXT_526571 [Caerostris extrusa]|uniref:Uncharacterized protein n=1 Tax=Caerostris extrusa TaxID=172846 RepID=A0AAV4PY95_CAEEX|nr:hypothetical protein CEXT_526571 [Caerostris extrusa]
MRVDMTRKPHSTGNAIVPALGIEEDSTGNAIVPPLGGEGGDLNGHFDRLFKAKVELRIKLMYQMGNGGMQNLVAYFPSVDVNGGGVQTEGEQLPTKGFSTQRNEA